MARMSRTDEMELCLDYLDEIGMKKIMEKYKIKAHGTVYRILEKHGVKRISEYHRLERGRYVD